MNMSTNAVEADLMSFVKLNKVSAVVINGERKVPWRCVTLENVFGLD